MHSIRFPVWLKFTEFSTPTELSGRVKPALSDSVFCAEERQPWAQREGVWTLTHQKSCQERRQRCSQAHPKVQAALGLLHSFFAAELGAQAPVTSLGVAAEQKERAQGRGELPDFRRAWPPLTFCKSQPPPSRSLQRRMKQLLAASVPREPGGEREIPPAGRSILPVGKRSSLLLFQQPGQSLRGGP